MGAIVRTLADKEKNPVYPVTKAEYCYLGNGVDTVERVLDDLKDQKTEISFGEGSISKTLASGSKVETVFLDGSIKETTTDKNGIVVQTKRTTFNDDGSISIEVE